MCKPVRVLHVDDDEEFADLTAAFLERADDRLAVETAAGAEEALARLDEGVDCVVSDYEMPGADGLEFLEAVRERDPDLPFVLFTSRGSEEIASEAISAGVTDYLQKDAGTETFDLLYNRVVNAVTERRAHTNYRELFERTHVGLTLHDPETGRITDANPAFAALTGYPAEELVGRHPAELAAPESGFTREKADQLIRKAAAGEPQTFEWKDRTRDGEDVWAEVSLGRLEVDGRRRVLAVVREITDRKEQERAFVVLNETARELMAAPDTETVLETAIDAAREKLGLPFSAILLYDDEAGVLRPEKTTSMARDRFGTPPTLPPGEGILGAAYADRETVLVDDLREDERAPDDAAIRSYCVVPLGEYGVYITASDEPGVLDESYREVAETLAATVEAALVRVDRERRLQRKNEWLERFAGFVSHDIRTPLAVAKGRLELAAADAESEHLAEAMDALDRMDALVDDLLALAREGERIGETEPVEVAELAADVWAALEARGSTLSVELEATVRADRGRLRQLFGNLFRNAVEHGSTEARPGADRTAAGGGGVEVTVGRLEGGFYVADDGTGIPPADRERVFDREYTTAANGSGFGLVIVDDVATAHDWEVRVTESDAGGARFEITGVDFAAD